MVLTAIVELIYSYFARFVMKKLVTERVDSSPVIFFTLSPGKLLAGLTAAMMLHVARVFLSLFS